ncbi:MAG: hypothetical protein KGI69_03700 [Patescibacteria group bacterium]|nr:hypothetical protein [Patescibacteria group bacterium]
MRTSSDFSGKRIAVVGLGPHGEMAADVRFLAKMNALVSIYDLRAEARIQSVVAYLRTFGLANHVCGAVPPEDLCDMDLIILSHEYPRDASFLSEAKKKGIPIEYPETLLLRSVPPVTVVAVMGASGKSTVISMLAPMIEAACDAEGTQSCFVVDPESPDGIVAHLRRMKSGDIVIMRVSDATAAEIRALDWSPHIAVFTSVPAAGIRGGGPFGALEKQTYNNYIIGEDSVIDAVKSSGVQPRAKMLRTRASMVPEEWAVRGRGPHDRLNAALALQAAKIFKVSDETAEKAIARWKPLKHRLEPVKKVGGVEFYNDAAALTPDATISGMLSLAKDRDLVVIIGGADGGSDYRELYAALPRYAHTVISVPGSGTLKERRALRSVDSVATISAPSLEEAVRSAMDHARKGDKVLFSPGFQAAGIDASRYERGERFVRAVRAL